MKEEFVVMKAEKDVMAVLYQKELRQHFSQLNFHLFLKV